MKPVLSWSEQLLELARSAHTRGDYREADRLVERIIDDPTSEPLIRHDALCLAAEIDLRIGRVRAARKHLSAAMACGLDEAVTLYRYAVTFDLDPISDVRAGYRAIKRAVRREPRRGDYWALAGRLAHRCGRDRAAVRAFLRAGNRCDGSAAVLSEVIDGLMTLGREEEAGVVLMQARMMHPRDRGLERLWQRFRFESARRLRMEESDDYPEVLSFPDAVRNTADGDYVRLDGPSAPRPHLLERLFGRRRV